jgi:hypothetical protein
LQRPRVWAYLVAGEPLTQSRTTRTELPGDSSYRPVCAKAQSQGDELNEDDVAAFISFFAVLERWDQEAKQDVEVV